MAKSCIRCSSFMRCKDPRKTITFHCDLYKETKQSLTQEKTFLEDILGTSFHTSALSMDLQSQSLILPESNAGMFDVKQALKDMMQTKRMVSPDLKIPEDDFPEAPNFHTWCVEDEFLGQKPFVMQDLIITRLLGEFCPTCSDVEWIDHGVKVGDSLDKFTRKVALLEHGVCPYCHKNKLHFYKKGLLNPYWELALVAGQRSGKSAVLAMFASYLMHRVIKMIRPNEVLGLLQSNVLHGTFVALTFAQASQTLYEPFYGNVLDSKWYQNYHSMLDSVTHKYGQELYKLKDSFIQYKHRRILVYPAGPDKRVLRGRTRFIAAIDELGWFNHGLAAAKNIKMSADEVYIALERSLLTVRAKAKGVVRSGFFNVPFGYFVNISSPSSVRDKIMELVRKSQGSKVMLGLNYPTWLMNPHVPKSALAEEFRKDPETAMRDYGAQPPLTNSPFISSGDKLELCFSKRPQSLKIRYKVVRSTDKTTSELYAELDSVKQSGKASILALDAGYSGNSFAFAVGHRASNGYPVISLVGEVMPQPGIRINHSLLYTHLLSALIPLRNVVLMAADRWNSLKVLSDAEQDFGIQKRQYSLKYVDMQLFKSYIDDMQILLPRPEAEVEEILRYDHSKYPECFKRTPAEHLVLQALTVQDTGSAVIKGDGLTDDILRAAMLAFRLIIDEEYDELFGQADAEVVSTMDLSQMAVSKLYSGGGSGSNGGGSSSSGSGNSLGVSKSRS